MLVLVLVLRAAGAALVLADRELARAQCQARCDSAHQDYSRHRASGVFATRSRCAAVQAYRWRFPARQACLGVVAGAKNQRRTCLVR